MPAANAKNLQEWFQIEPSIAKALAQEMKAAEGGRDSVERAIKNVDVVIHGYGVEGIEGEWVNNYWGNTVGLYVNMGDTYNGTVIYDTIRQKFSVTTMGDWVEKYERKYRIR